MRVVVLQCQEVTQHACGHGCAQHVPGLAVQRQALLEQRLCCGLVPGREEAEAGAAQRHGTLLRRQVSALGQDVRVGGEFLGVAAQPPEPPGRPGQMYRRLGLVLFHQPGHRGAEVAVLGLEPVQPRQLSGTLQLGWSRLGERPEVGRVTVVRSCQSAPSRRRSSAYSRMVSSSPKRGSPLRACGRTRLLSTSEPSVSMTCPARPGSAGSAAAAQTASAAGRSKVPANTPRRANSACSPPDSRSKLQSRVFRSVRCRSGRSRAPPVSSPILSSSRASRACGGSSLTLAAASSMASGSPSSRRHISATAPAFPLVSSKPADAACARCTNRRTEAHRCTSAASPPAPVGGTGSGGTGTRAHR